MIKFYESPEAEVIKFTIYDIITTSGGILDGDNSGEGDFGGSFGGEEEDGQNAFINIDEDMIEEAQDYNPDIADQVADELGGDIY